MEGAQGIGMKTRIATIIIILFHVVGLIGLLVPQTRPVFLHIVPWHIMLMFAVTVLAQERPDEKFLLFVALIFVLGFVLEWLGVHKYWLFGDYAYGSTLGVKLSDIPLTIGVNWFLLVFAAGVTMHKTRLKSTFFRVILGGLTLVLLDFLIEPAAIRLNYWHWDEGFVPVKNYMCWFGVGAGMLYIFELFGFKKHNNAAPVLLVTQFVFFGLLDLAALFGIFG
jgi:putative membrane protein